MDTFTLNAAPRETGKKATKAIRRDGGVPCVLYGAHQEPVHFSADVLTLRPLIHTARTYRVVVALDGEEYDSIVKDTVFHPVTSVPIHMDFQALTKGEKLTVTVPVHVEGTPAGVKAGGALSQPLYELEIRCLPVDIPGQVSLDVTELEIGDSIHVSDLALSDDIEVLTEESRTIVSVMAPRVEEVEEPAEDLLGLEAAEDGAEGDAAEGAEGAEASDAESAE